MTGRDRMVMIAVSVVLLLVVGWLLVVAPEREQAASLNQKVAAASAQLATANGQAASARGAEAQYHAAYSSLVSLGKAVPPSQEVPSLIYELAQASKHKNVQFAAISSGASGGASSSASSSPSGAAVTGFTPMPFSFVFNGSFVDLYNLFRQLDRATVVTTSGRVVVSGRLLTIESVKLAPQSSTEPTAGAGHAPELAGDVTATAYVLPASQGLTGSGTPIPGSSGQPVTTSSPAAPSSPTAPAIARVTP